MCEALADVGRLDVLSQIRDGGLRLLDVWQHYRAGDWSRLPTPEHARPLASAFEAWRQTVPGERHRRDLGLACRQLNAGRSHATVADLPAIVARLREHYAARGVGRHFNKLRDAASAFLKQTLTRRHSLYLEVRAIEPLVGTRHHARHPKAPDEAWLIANALGGEAGRIWWVMCCTGMGPKELWQDGFRVEEGHLRITGKKRRARDRVVPLIVADVEPPLLGRAGFLSALHRARLSVSAYDARRSFARWMEEAGILETHQQAYLGHGPRTITDLYRRAELAVAQLDADGERLAAYVVGFLAGPAVPKTVQVQVARGRIELPTRGFSVRCSTN